MNLENELSQGFLHLAVVQPKQCTATVYRYAGILTIG